MPNKLIERGATVMATESVDDDKRELDIFEEYSYYLCEFTPEKYNEQRCRWCGELEDEGRHTMKKAIEAYITRECARKVLEELEALKLNTGWTADDYRAVLNERIAHFRAAIEEVGDGEK